MVAGPIRVGEETTPPPGTWKGALMLALFLLPLFIFISSATAEETPNITVAAASDLQQVFLEIGMLYEKERGIRVQLVFGSSGMLARQIEQGASYDIFASANARYIEDLKAQGLIVEESQRLYAQGRIVIAVKKGGVSKPDTLNDLMRPEFKKVAIAHPGHAPYGEAAKEALVTAGVWDKLVPRIIYGENVRQVLQYIASNNVEAGIVALSITNRPDIVYALIDPSLHSPINQVMAVTKGSRKKEQAMDFISFIGSEVGRHIMKKHGFLLPGEF